MTDDETEPGPGLAQGLREDGAPGSDEQPKDPASDEHPDPASADDEAEAENQHAAEDGDDLDHPVAAERSRAGIVAFGVVRAAVVLIVAAVGYQAVVPMTHVSRSRLARLVVSKPGVAAYNTAQSKGGEQQASQSGVAALTTAAAKSPNKSGLYSVAWSASQTSGAGLAVFLFPDAAQATTGFNQLIGQQLAAGAYSSDGLKRLSTFSVSTVPGSTGSVYGTPKPAGQPGLAVTAFRYQRAVAIDEVFSTGKTQTDASTLSFNEYGHLQQELPGFSLSYVTHPVVATTLWAAGAAALAALAVFAPAGWRGWRRYRRRRIEAELATRVVVGGQVIHKRRL